ncbi:protein-L-isoaspartate(D-aspartate) O-methyltransferase [Phaeodactylibacter luteus]|uniref:Protein-L-isoaspartate O-methyltransferase n=1 Tax=Phaeodactylibacter luteus TaxID=1564516 RepID=A0A5C6RK32_9BACT|nr:protein-L-isoaspartate(D-aspartate) O-methyltransferase [Phaeodactylibacter luteus]TXB62796.1 protein-L-isoaspartate(D-aspartate) O-methyltransferase [Phaeodactylibacter luteus]
MKDTYRHKGLRRQLIEELAQKGISDQAVLDAMQVLPRHFFLDKAFEEWAYQDKAFPIGNEQTISQPYTVAFQTSLLNVQKRQKVLEIGTGSGYQASILALLGARVYTVERQEALYLRAQQLIAQLKPGNIRCYWRDGYKGLPEFAPFDKILVTAGAPEVPTPLLQQLTMGGQLVIPVGKGAQSMLRITRVSADEYEQEELGQFQFVPFLKGLHRK